MARDAVAEIRRSIRGKFGVGGNALFVLEANGMFARQYKIIADGTLR